MNLIDCEILNLKFYIWLISFNETFISRGGKYAVQEQEVAHGRGQDYDDGGGFMEYTQPWVETLYRVESRDYRR